MNACNQCIEKKMMTSFSPFEHEIHTKLISDVCRTSFHSTTALLLQMNPFFSASISHALSFSSISHKMVTSLITQHLFKRQPCFRIDHLASHLPSRKPSLTLSTPVLCASPQHATVMTITHTVHTRPVCRSGRLCSRCGVWGCVRRRCAVCCAAARPHSWTPSTHSPHSTPRSTPMDTTLP